MNRPLPIAHRHRWQPLRGGLVELYHFDNEEFWYDGGRLLLRGNNGTGKSRVLALQLPFLLDGETAPHRLEPDGDPAKKIAWNLLVDKHPDRYGYTWIEFGRRDQDTGEERYLTLGCGLHAVQGRGLVERWFFVTDRRVGLDLELIVARTVLTRTRLGETLGERGTLYTTATAYRRAVDEALFGLGEQRYGALLDLLIQLRQPQLSRHLDEERLSKALGDALPPMPEGLVGDVAESFRGLEEDEVALAGLRDAHRGVETFLTGYRRYARVASRRRAADVRRRHVDYESTQRALREAERARDQAAESLTAVAERQRSLAVHGETANAEIETLRQSPEMRDARALDEAAKRAVERRREAERAAAEVERAAQESTAQHEELTRAANERDAARRDAEALMGRTGERATACGLGNAHRSLVEPLLESRIEASEAKTDGAAIGAARVATDETTDRRRRAAERLRVLGRERERTAGALAVAKERQTRRAERVDEAMDVQKQAHEALRGVGERLIESWRAWRTDLRELVPVDAADLADAVEDWQQSGEGKSPLAAAVADAEAEASTRLASERADLDTRTADAQALYATLDAEREALEAGVHVPPPAPHTRDDAARADRPGAPLWQLIDRAPDLDDSASAGLEAALEASGLLDAWVTPDGRLEDRIDDTTLIASGSDAAISEPTGPTLADVLRLDEAPTGVAQAIEPAILGRILRSIGLVEIGRDDPDTAVWVATDGRFRVGPLRGAWHKEAAEHLGASAREARRQRRLTALADELDAAEAALDVFQRKAEHLDERAVRVRREAESAPDDTPMHRARAALDTAAIQVDRERRGLAEAEEAVAARRREHDAVVETARRDAEALGVTRWLDDPDALVEAVGAYREALAALWPTLRRHLDLLGRAVDAEARTRAADERLTRQHEEAESATRRAHQTEVEHQTLEATLGARVEEIQARLAAARHRHDRARAAIDAARDQERELSIEHAIAAREIEQRVEELSHHDAARSEAVGAFGRLETTRLLAVAVAEMADEQGIEQSVTRAVDLARRIESALSEVDSDDDAWERVQNLVLRRIEELKHDLLPHDMSPEVDSRDGLYQVQARFRGRVLDMAGLHAALADAVEEREQILSSKEKEILENHLIGEVSSYLHERLREAEEMVLEMNRELAERPTSTGMALRFVWQPRADGPDGLATARGLLLGNLGTWSSADRQAVGEFLHRTIQRQRDDDASGTWQEHLRLALDYRDWHVFGIERRHDDQWRRLTRRTHGTGSGGEKAIALTMPQFAAASAHYNSAKRPAPRLILLDEAFVGVDADMRAKCMGLLGAFDLDFVMTSEREWGCYSTLPGVAIVQLSTLPGVDAVATSRWVWNGRERRRDDMARES